VTSQHTRIITVDISNLKYLPYKGPAEPFGKHSSGILTQRIVEESGNVFGFLKGSSDAAEIA
jgi:hypothetical protein